MGHRIIPGFSWLPPVIDEASLPNQGTEGDFVWALAEQTLWYWDGSDWAQFVGGGGGGSAAPNQMVALRSGNNFGSTATKIHRFSNVDTNTGTFLTLAQSASNGDSVTVNHDGIYGVYINAAHSSAANYGISLQRFGDSIDLTANVYDLADPKQKIAYTTAQSSFAQASAAREVQCGVGDVIRPHSEGIGGASTHSMFGVIFLREVA